MPGGAGRVGIFVKMENFKIKGLGNCIVIILFTLLFISLVDAFGVTAPCSASECYYEGDPLIVKPEDSLVVYMTLQNMIDDDMIFRAKIDGGSEVARLIDEDLDYFVRNGQKDVKVNINVSVPQDVTMGKEYRVSVSFRQIV